MAARRGIALDDEHRRRVEAGEVTLAGLADELGASRQSLWEVFKRRGWSTTAVVDHMPQVSPGVGVDGDEPDGGDQLGVAGATGLAGRRSPPAAPSPPPTSTSVVLAAASAPALADFTSTSYADLVEAVRQEVANVGLLVIASARTMLSRPVGPAALKSIASAVGLAIDQLERVGYRVGDDPNEVVPVMRIEEYTARELVEIEAQAEREHKGTTDDD